MQNQRSCLVWLIVSCTLLRVVTQEPATTSTKGLRTVTNLVPSRVWWQNILNTTFAVTISGLTPQSFVLALLCDNKLKTTFVNTTTIRLSPLEPGNLVRVLTSQFIDGQSSSLVTFNSTANGGETSTLTISSLCVANGITFQGDGPRFFQLQSQNVTQGATLRFALFYGAGEAGQCEICEAEDALQIFLSVGGSPFQPWKALDLATYPVGTAHTVTLSLPTWAWSSNTVIRFEQLSFGCPVCDNCAIRNVEMDFPTDHRAECTPAPVVSGSVIVDEDLALFDVDVLRLIEFVSTLTYPQVQAQTLVLTGWSFLPTDKPTLTLFNGISINGTFVNSTAFAFFIPLTTTLPVPALNSTMVPVIISLNGVVQAMELPVNLGVCAQESCNIFHTCTGWCVTQCGCATSPASVSEIKPSHLPVNQNVQFIVVGSGFRPSPVTYSLLVDSHVYFPLSRTPTQLTFSITTNTSWSLVVSDNFSNNEFGTMWVFVGQGVHIGTECTDSPAAVFSGATERELKTILLSFPGGGWCEFSLGYGKPNTCDVPETGEHLVVQICPVSDTGSVCVDVAQLELSQFPADGLTRNVTIPIPAQLGPVQVRFVQLSFTAASYDFVMISNVSVYAMATTIPVALQTDAVDGLLGNFAVQLPAFSFGSVSRDNAADSVALINGFGFDGLLDYFVCTIANNTNTNTSVEVFDNNHLAMSLRSPAAGISSFNTTLMCHDAGNNQTFVSPLVVRDPCPVVSGCGASDVCEEVCRASCVGRCAGGDPVFISMSPSFADADRFSNLIITVTGEHFRRASMYCSINNCQLVFQGDTSNLYDANKILFRGPPVVVANAAQQTSFGEVFTTPGPLNVLRWARWTGVTISSFCSSTVSATFGGVEGARFMDSVPLSVGGGSTITTTFLGSGSCDAPNTDSQFELQYSLDGAQTFTTIDTFQLSEFGATPTAVTTSIPIGAWSSSTTFRWKQMDSACASCDYVQIVSINVTTVPAVVRSGKATVRFGQTPSVTDMLMSTFRVENAGPLTYTSSILSESFVVIGSHFDIFPLGSVGLEIGQVTLLPIPTQSTYELQFNVTDIVSQVRETKILTFTFVVVADSQNTFRYSYGVNVVAPSSSPTATTSVSPSSSASTSSTASPTASLSTSPTVSCSATLSASSSVSSSFSPSPSSSLSSSISSSILSSPSSSPSPSLSSSISSARSPSLSASHSPSLSLSTSDFKSFTASPSPSSNFVIGCGETRSASTVGAVDTGGQSSGDHNFNFTLTSTSRESITFDACQSTFDTYLTVYNSSGVVGLCDDCGCGGGSTSKLTLTLEPGSYVIRIEGFRSLTGTYVLSVQCPPSQQIASSATRKNTSVVFALALLFLYVSNF